MWDDLKANDWIAICAGFVALLALGVTLWQSVIARRHNHLSARPILDIGCHSRGDEVIGISFKNCGPGPAFLLSVKVTFRKTRYNLFNRNEFKAMFTDFAKSGLPAVNFSLAIPTNTSVIASGQQLDLFTISDTDNRKGIAAKFDDLMHSTKIEVSYKSLYGHIYTAEFERPIVECA
jgi:hypothetical protein